MNRPAELLLWREAAFGATQAEIVALFPDAVPERLDNGPVPGRSVLRVAHFEILEARFEVLLKLFNDQLVEVTLMLSEALDSSGLVEFSAEMESLLKRKYGRADARKSKDGVAEVRWLSNGTEITMTSIDIDGFGTNLSVDYKPAKILSNLHKI